MPGNRRNRVHSMHTLKRKRATLRLKMLSPRRCTPRDSNGTASIALAREPVAIVIENHLLAAGHPSQRFCVYLGRGSLRPPAVPWATVAWAGLVVTGREGINARPGEVLNAIRKRLPSSQELRRRGVEIVSSSSTTATSSSSSSTIASRIFNILVPATARRVSAQGSGNELCHLTLLL